VPPRERNKRTKLHFDTTSLGWTFTMCLADRPLRVTILMWLVAASDPMAAPWTTDGPWSVTTVCVRLPCPWRAQQSRVGPAQCTACHSSLPLLVYKKERDCKVRIFVKTYEPRTTLLAYLGPFDVHWHGLTMCVRQQRQRVSKLLSFLSFSPIITTGRQPRAMHYVYLGIFWRTGSRDGSERKLGCQVDPNR
jgi:hypothetical protein